MRPAAVIGGLLVMMGLAAEAQACVLLQDVDYSVLYRSDAIVRAKVIGYQARPEQKDALFRLEIEQVLSGKPLAAPVIEARWERRYKPAPQIWDGYNNVIVGLKLTNGAPALIVRPGLVSLTGRTPSPMARRAMECIELVADSLRESAGRRV